MLKRKYLFIPLLLVSSLLSPLLTNASFLHIKTDLSPMLMTKGGFEVGVDFRANSNISIGLIVLIIQKMGAA